MLSEEASHRRTNPVGFHSYEVPRVAKFVETHSRMMGTVGWKLLFGGCRVTKWDLKVGGTLMPSCPALGGEAVKDCLLRTLVFLCAGDSQDRVAGAKAHWDAFMTRQWAWVSLTEVDPGALGILIPDGFFLSCSPFLFFQIFLLLVF